METSTYYLIENLRASLKQLRTNPCYLDPEYYIETLLAADAPEMILHRDTSETTLPDMILHRDTSSEDASLRYFTKVTSCIDAS